MADIDLNQLTNLATQQKAGLAGRYAGYGTQEEDFLKKYGAFISGQEAMPAMYQRLSEELGLPELRAGYGTLQTTLRNLPYTYGKATTGFDVTQNQLQRIIAQKASELAPTVESMGEALGRAESQLTTRMGLGQAEQARLEKPYTMGQTFLVQRIARENAGYTQADENELNALIAKINAGVTLSEGEKNRANQLAIAEKNYQAEMERIKASTAGPEYLSLAEGTTLFDPTTGQVVYRAPKTYKPTSSSTDPLGLGL